MYLAVVRMASPVVSLTCTDEPLSSKWKCFLFH